jgi:hypothetical protein
LACAALDSSVPPPPPGGGWFSVFVVLFRLLCCSSACFFLNLKIRGMLNSPTHYCTGNETIERYICIYSHRIVSAMSVLGRAGYQEQPTSVLAVKRNALVAPAHAPAPDKSPMHPLAPLRPLVPFPVNKCDPSRPAITFGPAVDDTATMRPFVPQMRPLVVWGPLRPLV